MKRPAPESPTPQLVVVAGRSLRHRLVATLMVNGMTPTAATDRPDKIAGLDLDGSAIVVFACNVDRAAKVTSLRRLCRTTPDPAVVVVSPQTTATAVRRILDAGAAALVFEEEIEAALPVTIRAVDSGQSVVPRRLRASVARPTLSHRERQILTLVCNGHTNAEVAAALHLAESTVKSHLASIFTKFGVHSRKEAVAAFLDLNLRLGAHGAPPRPLGVGEGLAT